MESRFSALWGWRGNGQGDCSKKLQLVPSFFHYHVFIKATQIPIHKKYFYSIYNKVNNIVLHSVLWKLLDADVSVEFCL